MSLLRRALGPFLSLGLVLSSVPLPVWSAQRIAAPGARVQAELPPALGSTPAAFADQLGLELSALSALAGGLETAPASAAPESAASPAPSLALPAALPEEGSLRREVYRALDRAFDDSRAAQALLESARAGAAPGDAQAADAAARKLSEFLESRRADPGLRAWVRELAGPERAAEAAAGFDGSRLLRGEPSSLSRILDFYHPERARAAAAPAPLGLAAPLGGAQDAAAAPAAPETTPPPVAAASADPVAVRFGGWLGWVSPLKLIANVLDLLHMFALRRLMRKLINRLYIPGDSREYSVELIAKPEPNAYIWPEKALMGVYLGLLPFVRNLDEFASVLAHEMTHQNKEHLKAATDTEDVRRFLDNLEGYSDMDAGQREEMRADLGSLDRMIKSGFNPWAAYEFEKRITAFQSKLFSLKILKHLFRIILGRSFDYWEAHPAGEVRMKAMKAYIIHRGFREDLSKVTENGFQSLPWGVRLIRFWMILPTFLFTSPWMWRLYLAYLSYNVVFMVIALFDTSAAHVARENADAAVNATKGFFSLLWDSAYQNVLTPIGHFLSPIWSRFLGPILGGLWLLVKEAGAGLLKLYMLPFQLLFPKLKPMEAVFVGFVGSLLYMARRMGIAKDATYKNFAAAKDGLRTVRRSFRKLAAKGRLDDALLVRHLALAESRLHDLEEVHRRGGFIRKLSELTGLDWLRWRWRSFHKELLSELSSRLSKRDPEGRAALYALARPQLDRVPGFLLEYSAERKLLERIAAQGGGTRAPPARRYRGRALAAPLSELRLSLLGSADALPAQAGPADILRLVEQLRRAGLVDTARKVFDRNYARTLDFVLSEDSPDGASLRIWLESENDFRARASLWKVGFPARAWRDWKLFLAGLRGVGRDLAWRMAYTAMAHKVPRAVWPWVSPRWWADLVGRFLIRRELGRLHSSVAGLKAFADRLASARHVDLEPLSIEFHRVLVGHPGWVVGREDLDALVAAEYFWPKFGGNSPGFLETLLVEAVKKLSEKYPDRWKYEPGSSEKLHGVYLAGLERLGLSPADWEGRLELWKTLTDRGVTSRTDAMFAELYAGAPAARRLEVEDLALREGRVWEQGLKASIVERRLKEGAAFRALLVEKDPGPRRALLRAVIDELQKDYPERGLYYERILEGVSREIRSDMEESAVIHEAKNPATGERGEDLGLRVLSDMLQTAHGWSRRQQWRLVLFLRGDAPPTRKIRRAFRVVGTERVRRMFEILPVLGRTELLDAFLDSPQGLAGTIDLRRGYGRRILEHVLPKGDPEARRVAYEVLESFLYALKRTTGSSGLQSYVLAYMLSMPKAEASSVGNILKGILEIFGATGVKIGQFLAASQLLPEEETRILRGLQEQALEPEREHMYQDLREITGRNDLPFAVEDLLGAASIKYAFSARELGAGQKVVLKVFRLSAMAHTPTEFTLLGHMAKRLRRHGPEYGIFQAIVKAARRAVERELRADNEIERARVARESVYADASGGGWQVEVPHEVKVYDRLLASEFAEGGSIWALPEELRPLAAKKILEMERAIYFKDADVIRFDPDRHPGNYRIKARGLSPIDHGQGLEISRAERERIFDLFALAQVMRHTGSTRWSDGELARVLGLEGAPLRAASKALNRYFPDAEALRLKGEEDPGEARRLSVRAYYSLLAALDESGQDLDIAYFDYVRGLVQLSQYEEFHPALDGLSPTAALHAEVEGRARRMAARMSLGSLEKLGVARARGWARLSDFLRYPELRFRARQFFSRVWVRRALLAAALFLAWPAIQGEVLPVLRDGFQWVRDRISSTVDSEDRHEQALWLKIEGKPEAEVRAIVLERLSHSTSYEYAAAEAVLKQLISSRRLADQNALIGELLAKALDPNDEYSFGAGHLMTYVLFKEAMGNSMWVPPASYVPALVRLADGHDNPGIRLDAFKRLSALSRAGLAKPAEVRDLRARLEKDSSFPKYHQERLAEARASEDGLERAHEDARSKRRDELERRLREADGDGDLRGAALDRLIRMSEGGLLHPDFVRSALSSALAGPGRGQWALAFELVQRASPLENGGELVFDGPITPIREFLLSPGGRDAVIGHLADKAVDPTAGENARRQAATALLRLYPLSRTVNENHVPRAQVDALVRLVENGDGERTRLAAHRQLQDYLINGFVHPRIIREGYERALKRGAGAELREGLQRALDGLGKAEKLAFDAAKVRRDQLRKTLIDRNVPVRRRVLAFEGIISLYANGMLSRDELESAALAAFRSEPDFSAQAQRYWEAQIPLRRPFQE